MKQFQVVNWKNKTQLFFSAENKEKKPLINKKLASLFETHQVRKGKENQYRFVYEIKLNLDNDECEYINKQICDILDISKIPDINYKIEPDNFTNKIPEKPGKYITGNFFGSDMIFGFKGWDYLIVN